MIAFDTNVMVRILVADDVAQTRAAKALVKRLDRAGERVYVADIVLCEVVWVLRAAYGFSRSAIADALRKLTAARQLVFQSHDNILCALAAYENGMGDFADYLIQQFAQAAGAVSVATFDKKLLKEDGFISP